MSYSESLIKEAAAHYSALKRESGKRAEHYLSVLHSNEDYLKAYNAYQSAKFDLSKANFEKNAMLAKKAESEIERQKSEMIKIREKLKIKKEWLYPEYSCPYCRDTGTLDNGEKCQCYKAFMKSAVLEKLGIKEKNYPDFHSSAKKTENNLENIYSKVQTYIDKFGKDTKSPLVISGAVGVGKSHLAACVAGEIVKKGYDVIFLSAYEMHQIFLKYASAPFGEKDDYLEILTECDLLVIDDLGCEPILNNVSIQNLYAIVSERYAKNLPLIITTNLDRFQISERYGECIFSRLFDVRFGVEIRISGEDLRLKRK